MARAKNRAQNLQAPAPTLHSFKALRYSRSTTVPKLTCLERLASEEALLNINITIPQKLLFSQPNITWFCILPFVQTEIASCPNNSQGTSGVFFKERGHISHKSNLSTYKNFEARKYYKFCLKGWQVWWDINSHCRTVLWSHPTKTIPFLFSAAQACSAAA